MTRLEDTIEIIDWSGVKALLLDLDNTLYSYKPCHESGLRASHGHLVKSGTDVEFNAFLSGYEAAKKRVKAYTNGQGASHSRFLYFQGLLESLRGRTELTLTSELERVYWENFMDEMSLAPGARELLEHAKRQGAKTCVVTDLTAPIQFEKLRRLGVGDLVDFVVSSEEAGSEKPAPPIFVLALAKLGISPTDALHIGDDEKKDVRGGEAAGVRTILIEL